jgi:chromate reductase
MNVGRTIHVLGFVGSLREGSYNESLLRAAQELMPENARLEIFDLDEIPLFNQDFERDPPDTVKEFKAKIRGADAILIATPEYNHSIPGVLKNAIDWASRPYGDNSFNNKPVAIMSASPGILGGARAQYPLRHVLTALNMHPINHPEVFVAYADEKIDEKGDLTDQETRGIIGKLLERLVTRAEESKR